VHFVVRGARPLAPKSLHRFLGLAGRRPGVPKGEFLRDYHGGQVDIFFLMESELSRCYVDIMLNMMGAKML
jgi:hypothetical protein